MTCRELIEFLMAYLDGELPAEQRVVFDRHLEICEACRNYLSNYEQTVALGQTVCAEEDEALAAEVPEELVRAILAARER